MSATLYERLGGVEKITKLVDDVVEEHMTNPLVNPRFLPYLEDSQKLAVIKLHTVNFFCAGAGGPEEYGGRDMITTHKGMNISEQEYVSVVDDIMNAMDKNHYEQQEKNDVVAILFSLKNDIIRK